MENTRVSITITNNYFSTRVSITITNNYFNGDVRETTTEISETGSEIEILVSAFKAAMFATGFHPTTIERVFGGQESED